MIMNENLNLVEILKECPKGTKLYSITLGEVKLYKIEDVDDYPIVIETMTGHRFLLAKDGRYSNIFDGECTLFPSKDQRDWKKFIPPCKFKDGDIVTTSSGSQVFILNREEISGKGYCYIGYNFKNNMLFPEGEWLFNRLATEEEKQKLFDAIKLNGYKWNAETKTLEKLVKPKFKVGDKIVNSFGKYIGASVTQGTISKITNDKYIFTDSSYISISNQDSWKLVPDRFDPKTLKPFDKVLVRNCNVESWRSQLFSHILEGGIQYPYLCINNPYKYCIPYNDETKNLVGTKNEAPEYYRYWED